MTEAERDAAIVAALDLLEQGMRELRSALAGGLLAPPSIDKWPPPIINFEDGNWVTAKEAAARLLVDPDTVTSWCRSMKIGVQIGRQWRVFWPRLMELVVTVPGPIGKIGKIGTEALPAPPTEGDDPVDLTDGNVADG